MKVRDKSFSSGVKFRIIKCIHNIERNIILYKQMQQLFSDWIITPLEDRKTTDGLFQTDVV